MISIKAVKAIARENNNSIAGNLLPLLGYEDNDITKMILDESGITVEDDIAERRGEESFCKDVLSNQEAIYYALSVQAIEDPGDIRRQDLQRALFSAYEPYLEIKAFQLCKNHMNDVEDLRQEGAIALHTAILNYDPDCSPYFAGYANPAISFAMNKANYKQLTHFKWNEDVEIKTLHLKAFADENEISNWDDEEISIAAEKIGISEKRIRKYIGYLKYLEPLYFNTIADYDMDVVHTQENGGKIVHRQIDFEYSVESAEDEYFENSEGERITVTLESLPEREADILKDYAGLNDNEPKLMGNITAISRKYGESRREMDKEIISIRKKLLKTAV